MSAAEKSNSEPKSRFRSAFAALRARVRPGDELSWVEIEAEERARVLRRRARLESTGGLKHGMQPNHVGLALSGGGIRSATFSLGVLRSLSRLNVLPRIDYLSTVSGGGYAGAFYCSLFVPHPLRGVSARSHDAEAAGDISRRRADDLGEDVFGSNIGRRAVEQLREGGHFLNPNGTSDTLFAAVVAIRNWLAVALVTGAALLALFLLISLPRLAPCPELRNPVTFLLESSSTAAAEGKEDSGAMLGCLAQQGLPDRDAGSSEASRINLVSAAPSWHIGSSWIWILSLLIIPLWTAPCAWAYWLTRSGRYIPKARAARVISWIGMVAVLVPVTLFEGLWGKLDGPALRAVAAAVVFASLGSIVAYALAERRSLVLERREQFGGPATTTVRGLASWVAEENRVRSRLSRWLFRGFAVAIALALLALADDAGRLLYHLAIKEVRFPPGGAVGASPLLIVPIARWLFKRMGASELLSWPRVGPLLRRFGRAIALVFGLLLLFLLVIFWSAAAHALVWQGMSVPDGVTGSFEPDHLRRVFLLTLTVGIIALAVGRVHSFLNQSSLSSFYAGRLRKAYLGASNLERIAQRTAADLELPTDDIQLDAYYHPGVLAPVHLINVTINETTSQSSRVIQRDRKGKSMTVSPAGYIFTRNVPTEKPVGFKLNAGEQLPLSTWMGISGAAFSTGMGHHSGLGLSLLAGLSNMRLGYWWDSAYVRGGFADGSKGKTSGLLATAGRAVRNSMDDLVQGYLLREIRGSFEGTHSNRWYLSDGGHFENTAIYELVRRRLPFIIACDNGADPTYAFGDLVNLIRKIRIDFDAETELVSNAELDRLLGTGTALRAAFGTLEDMIPSDGEEEKGASGPHAALARISYQHGTDLTCGTPTTTLLLIKPRVGGAGLPDLLRYKRSNVAFPQQPTTDLFFDEAQWESYYRLGQLLAEMIFTDERQTGLGSSGESSQTVAPIWRPWDLRPLP